MAKMQNMLLRITDQLPLPKTLGNHAIQEVIDEGEEEEKS